MKIIFFGTPEPVVPILLTLFTTYDLIAVVTAPDKKAGRKQQMTPSPVKTAYEQLLREQPNGEISHPPQIFTPHKITHEFIKDLALLEPDLIVVAAYGKILPKALLAIPVFGALCVHPSLLPKHRGPSPVQQTLLDGDPVTGVTIYKMDEKVDHGPMIAAAPYVVHDTDTFESLMEHLFTLGAEILPDVIKNYGARTTELDPQDESKATFTKLVKKDDGQINLHHPPEKEKLQRMIRAYYPWPGVWAMVQVKNKEVRLKFLPNNMLQLEGKNPASYKDFLNGYPELKEVLQKVI